MSINTDNLHIQTTPSTRDAMCQRARWATPFALLMLAAFINGASAADMQVGYDEQDGVVHLEGRLGLEGDLLFIGTGRSDQFSANPDPVSIDVTCPDGGRVVQAQVFSAFVDSPVYIFNATNNQESVLVEPLYILSEDIIRQRCPADETHALTYESPVIVEMICRNAQNVDATKQTIPTSYSIDVACDRTPVYATRKAVAWHHICPDGFTGLGTGTFTYSETRNWNDPVVCVPVDPTAASLPSSEDQQSRQAWLDSLPAADGLIKQPTMDSYVKVKRDKFTGHSSNVSVSGRGVIKAKIVTGDGCSEDPHMLALKIGEPPAVGHIPYWREEHPFGPVVEGDQDWGSVAVSTLGQAIQNCQLGRDRIDFAVLLISQCGLGFWDRVWDDIFFDPPFIETKARKRRVSIGLQCDNVLAPNQALARVRTALWEHSCPDGLEVARTRKQVDRRSTGADIPCMDPRWNVDQIGTDKACPFLYVVEPESGKLRKQGELIKDLVGRGMEGTQELPLDRPHVDGGVLRVVVREEKDEVAYLDLLALKVGENVVAPLAGTIAASRLAARDGNYLVLKKGEEVAVDFELTGMNTDSGVAVISTGYYEPVQ